MLADASGPALVATAEGAKAAEAGAPALAQIDRLIGQARCTADEQCRVAGLGSRACGGPESFRAWSTQTTSATALDKQLQSYANERQRWSETAGLMSTCEMLPVPASRCEAASNQPGRCVLVSPATTLQR